MKEQLPTSRDIEELVSFLPRLYADGCAPVSGWGGGSTCEDGFAVLPWPVYDNVVEEFFRAASRESWRDSGYVPEEAGRMIEDDDFIKTADLAQIKTMLTFCVRGERFCPGIWHAMIEGGHIRRLLQRLAEFGG